jgi:hypothetical protein
MGSDIRKRIYCGLHQILFMRQKSGGRLCVCVCVCVHVKLWEIHWVATFNEVNTSKWHFRSPASEFSLLSTHPYIKICRNVTSLVVLYECDTWYGTFRVRVFENRVLRWIFRPKTDEVSEEWRRLYNEGLYDLYSSRNSIWVIKPGRMSWTGQ